MSVQALLIIGICIVMAILVVTLICVNRAYAFKYKPQQNNQAVE